MERAEFFKSLTNRYDVEITVNFKARSIAWTVNTSQAFVLATQHKKYPLKVANGHQGQTHKTVRCTLLDIDVITGYHYLLISILLLPLSLIDIFVIYHSY